MLIQEALNVSERTISFRDAEVLLGAVLGVDRSWLYGHAEQLLTKEQQGTYLAYVDRREHNEPVAYIIGKKEFYGRLFKTDKRALIPRPETEGLIERALQFLPGEFKRHINESNKPCALRILELGTGSGNISVTLAAELAQKPLSLELIATDISPEALALAEENYQQLVPIPNQNIRLTFLEASLFDHPKIQENSPYHLILANLPYVSTTWQSNPAAQPDVVFHEPDIALFGGSDGLDLYREFFAEAPAQLAEGGRIIIEYGEDQTSNISPLAHNTFPSKTITVHQDYAGLDRLLEIS